MVIYSHIFTFKKFSTFANLLIEKPGIDLLVFFFYKQPVYKQLAVAGKIPKQLSGFNPFSLSNNKTRLKRNRVFPLQ